MNLVNHGFACSTPTMAIPNLISQRLGFACRYGAPLIPRYVCASCLRTTARFSTSARQRLQENRGPFRTRLRAALKDTKIQWKPIPVGLGISFLGAVQFYRVREREKRRQQEEKEALEEESRIEYENRRPRKRERIWPSGPWCV